MSCYHPMVAVLQEVKENGKGRYKIFGQREGEQFLAKKDDPLMPPMVQIPCGQCLGCRLDHAKMWAARCMMELQAHQEAYFLTLTYDDDHLRKMVLEDGSQVPTLYKKDLQDFWKRLRRDGQKIRYFACGEYGDQTARPHYHAIVFGLHLEDRLFFGKASKGQYSYYTSDYLVKMWSHGHVLITDVTFETCSYCARYVVKKVDPKKRNLFEDLGILNEFSVMSRRPGIGRAYYDSHPDLFNTDYIYLSTQQRGLTFRPPRYFRTMFEKDYPEVYARIKKRAKLAGELITGAKLAQSSYSEIEALEIEERYKERQMKICARKML